MYTIIRNKLKMGAPLLLVVAALLGLAVLSQAALAAPGGALRAATLPAETCTLNAGVRTCELWATTGTLSLPGTSVTIWGYADTAGGAASLPGPAIIANEGETVEVVLHNDLPVAENTALNFQGQAMIPDLVGVAKGDTITRTFTATQPGTFLYEAGLLPNAQHQVAMGMFGALIVRPSGAPNQAYTDAATAFDDEALVVLSEVDPLLNNRANPADFDMRNYKPRYWLINGKAYPDTDPIPTTAGNRVLLRYINAGLQPYTMNLLGLDQALLGIDGSPLPYSRRVVVNTIAPGQTVDALASVPAATLDGTRLGLYEGNFLLHNNGAAGFGGMLTFLSVSAAGPGDGEAPSTSNVVVAPSTTNGLEDVTVTADVTADTTVVLTNTVTAAEFYIDATSGTPYPMAASDGAFDEPTEPVTATLLAADVAALPTGVHTIYVHGQDSVGVWGPFATATLTVDKSGPTTLSVSLAPNPTDEKLDVTVTATITADANAAEFYVDATTGTPWAMIQATDVWTGTIPTTTLASLATGDHSIYVRGQNAAGIWGAFNFAVLHLDKDGPATTSLGLTPNPSGGGVDVILSGTGDDRASGNSNIVAAEYYTDTAGIRYPMTVNVAAPVASLSATILKADVAALGEGVHTVYVHSQDFFGHWGPEATIDLKVDQTGPDTSNVVAAPSPNNGSLPINPSQLSVRVDATISEPGAGPVTSNVKTAEGFIDTVGGDGTGFPFTPRDGLFNSPLEDAYAFIPLSTINALAEGTHQIGVHGQDSSGNWGAVISTTLDIDKTAPTVSNVIAAPNPTAGAPSVTLTADAADSLSNGVISNIARAEFYIDADPGVGNGTAMQATDGTFDSPTEALTAEVNVGGLTSGPHTLYVRTRDAAGNWSVAASTVLTVVTANDIFADSFEAGNTNAWNGGTVGPVNVINAAAMSGDGGTWGMAVTLAGNTPGYVIDTTPVAEPSYHARFYFNPNGTITGNTQQTIFVGKDGAGADIFRVQYRRTNAQGGTYQVRGWVQTAGGPVTTPWVTITNGPHAVEIAWASGNPASFALYVDGNLVQTLNGLNTSAYLLEAVWLGPSAGLVNASSGVEYFDAFVSTRTTVIGP